jgi:hypothetical protein
MRKKADWNYVKSIAPSLLFGLLIGWLLITLFTDKIIRLIAGLGLLLLSIIHWSLQYISKFNLLPMNNIINHNSYLFKIQNSNILMKYIIGFIAGILSTVANVAGPLLAVFLIYSNKSPITITSTRAMIFTFANIIKIPMHLINSNMNLNDFPLILSLIIISLLSTYLTEKYILSYINNRLLENTSWLFIFIAAIFCII